MAPDEPEETIEAHVASMVSERLQKAISAVPVDIWDMSEAELCTAIFGHGEPVRSLENRIRISFWREYERALVAASQGKPDPSNSGNSIKVSNIIKGVTSLHYFYESFITNHFKVAWLLKQPVQYQIAAEDLLDMANRRCREILELPIKDAKGRPNSKLCEIVVRIRSELEQRVQGSVVQKQQSLNVNVDVNGKAIQQAAGGQGPSNAPLAMTREQLDARIQELSNQLVRIGLPPAQTQARVLTEQIPEAEFVEKKSG